MRQERPADDGRVSGRAAAAEHRPHPRADPGLRPSLRRPGRGGRRYVCMLVLCVCVCVSVCVCVCARARVMRGKMAVAMVVGKRVSRRESAIITEACACVRACVRAGVRACMRACAIERERERCLYVHVFVICG